LYNANVADELPSGLTGREREIAVLAADGLRNNEIAEKLFVSENTVRAHLRSIYQKLDIDRRAKLAGKLK
jgi:LuxR family maltose regulon positive regulatory protein